MYRWGDESWTALCGPAAAAVGGLWAETLLKSAGRPSKWRLYIWGWRWAAIHYCAISLATNSSLKALRGTDLSRRSSQAPVLVGASSLKWKSSEMTAWTWCDGQGAERSDVSGMSGGFTPLIVVFDGECVNADIYQELLRQHVVSWVQRDVALRKICLSADSALAQAIQIT
jgi:hypothetical protein